MKFLNGMWLVKEGVEILRAKEAYEIFSKGDRLEITAPTSRIENRGVTLNLPVISIELSSPRNDVIRIKMVHHAGTKKRGPHFQISEQKADISILEKEDRVIYTSGNTSAHVLKGSPLIIEYYYKDRFLTRSGDSLTGIAYIRSGGKPYMREMLNLSVGEKVYGLGEQFGAFTKNGQTVDMWNEDGGTCTEIAYKNVPFYLTNRGYGVFVNHTGKVSFEIGSEVTSKAQFSVSGEEMEYMLFGGDTLRDVLVSYTDLTGKPALPPAWSFGLWLTTSFTTSYDEETVNHFVDGMEERHIPLHVFHYDCFWMREFRWCDFTFDRRMFPDPAGMLRRMKSRGLKICVWINPYIGQLSSLFPEAAEKGYLLTKPNGDIYQTDLWQAGMGIVDFTNPEAVSWYQEKLQELVNLGVDCFKTDFGERIPTNVVYWDGSDPERMHNYYTYLYNKTVFEVLEKNYGKGQAVLFARSGTAGCQQFPVHWGGDCSGTYESMAETLRGGLSLSASGYSFWSHDISGFENTATPDLYKRWCAFGLLSTHSRLHGSSSYRVPWNFDEEASDVLRFFVNLKCRLMPYLFSAAVKAHETGIPVLRPMAVDYTKDRGCDDLDRQFLLGDSLLVAPVFNEKGDVDFYTPAGGVWTHFLDGETFEGGRWYSRKYSYTSLGLLAAPGSIIPIGKNEQDPVYKYADGITYRIYPDLAKTEEVFSFTLYEADGTRADTVSVMRKGNQLSVSAEKASYPWQVDVLGKTYSAGAGEKEMKINLNI